MATPAAKPRTGTPSNRSLARGLGILRCFKPGVGALANGELAHMTGLPKATVTRLTQTLVAGGFLRYDPREQGYRLGYALLSMGHAVILDSDIVRIARPIMCELGQAHGLNVGLSVGDHIDMVYLAAVQFDQTRLTRRFAPGTRRPMYGTAIGSAYLSALPLAERAALMDAMRRRCGERWPSVHAAMRGCAHKMDEQGFCDMAWDDAVSVATPVLVPGHAPCVVNISFNVVARPENRQWRHLADALLASAARMQQACSGLYQGG